MVVVYIYKTFIQVCSTVKVWENPPPKWGYKSTCCQYMWNFFFFFLTKGAKSWDIRVYLIHYRSCVQALMTNLPLELLYLINLDLTSVDMSTIFFRNNKSCFGSVRAIPAFVIKLQQDLKFAFFWTTVSCIYVMVSTLFLLTYTTLWLRSWCFYLPHCLDSPKASASHPQ